MTSNDCISVDKQAVYPRPYLPHRCLTLTLHVCLTGCLSKIKQRTNACTCCVPSSAGGLLPDSSMLTMSLPN